MRIYFLAKNEKITKNELYKYLIVYYFPSHIMDQRTLDAKEALLAYMYFGARIVEGYRPPDLTNATPEELWRHWSSFETLMRRMRIDGSITVSYGGGPFVRFVPGQDNFHQALALACFLYHNPAEDAWTWVSAPHVRGDEFHARFRKTSNNTVTYVAEDGRTVRFLFAEA